MTTEEGAQAWRLLQRGGGQLRLSGMGSPSGLDLSALLSLGQAEGQDAQVLAALLPHGEAGLLAGLRDRKNTDAEQT